MIVTLGIAIVVFRSSFRNICAFVLRNVTVHVPVVAAAARHARDVPAVDVLRVAVGGAHVAARTGRHPPLLPDHGECLTVSNR